MLYGFEWFITGRVIYIDYLRLSGTNISSQKPLNVIIKLIENRNWTFLMSNTQNEIQSDVHYIILLWIDNKVLIIRVYNKYKNVIFVLVGN